ncbi:MAG TPA: hypothetical protein VF668_07040 [Pyrinomonadaceae bacterium]|jgi:hypothetical protein
MPEPTPASLELAQSILEQEDNPVTGFLALTIGQVMSLNYDGLVEIFNERRGEFEARGAGDLLRAVRADVDNLFSGFINIGEE